MNTSLPVPPDDSTANEAKRILLEDLKTKQRRIIGLDREGVTGLFTTQGRGVSIDGLGLPVGLLVAIGITGFVIVWWLSFVLHILPDNASIIFIVIYAAFIGLLVAYKFAMLSRKVIGLTKETNSSPIVPIVMIIIIAVAALFVANFLIGILRLS